MSVHCVFSHVCGSLKEREEVWPNADKSGQGGGAIFTVFLWTSFTDDSFENSDQIRHRNPRRERHVCKGQTQHPLYNAGPQLVPILWVPSTEGHML